MTQRTLATINTWEYILIAFYFLILFAERTQSIVRAAKNKVLFTDSLHKYMAVLCFVSFVGTFGLIVARFISSSKFRQASMNGDSNLSNYAIMQLVLLVAAVGCILLSGMVHTEYTIPGIQFGAYGLLIVAMVLRVIANQNEMVAGKKALMLLYVIAFSMAIPVVYASQCRHKTAFHITECIVSFVLVVIFSIMFFALFYGNYKALLNPLFLIIALIGDILVLALRWDETINWFVLVSLGIATLAWIVCACLGMLR